MFSVPQKALLVSEKRLPSWACERLRVKALAGKPVDLSQSLGLVEQENKFLRVILCPPYLRYGIHIGTKHK